MRNRRFSRDVGLTTAAIDVILERGSLDDWLALRDAAKLDDAVGGRIAHVCRAHKMYGTSVLWIEIIARLNDDQR